ncbi:hypothetical protein LOAG_03572 [Loa loa]|uniref:DUF155 domain-containing protein n=1 Tax=Loa loa TaxID=7209 RepID=A0A1I7VCJ1_LOALO|nr:hypothetical protein LOAG_03572 [Loa loa]EFO24907.1 hypothetical protein LOAG_03572 [Loa loa]
MCSHQAEFTVAKHLVGFMSIVMDGCIFIWVGNRNRLDTLCFAQNFRGMNLIESSKPNYLVDGVAVKLNKLFPNKQVFFSSDLRIEDASFWTELLQAITDYVSKNEEIFGIVQCCS